MRAKSTRNGFRLRAYGGTTGVLLAMDVTQHKRQGLLGFAIEREGPGRKHLWLRGLLRFPGQVGEKLTPIDSKVAPIQKFRWSDYSVYPATSYRYRVHGVYGSLQNLRLKGGGEVSFNQTSRTGRGPKKRLTLATDDGWTDRYFIPESYKALERQRFCK